MVGLAFSGPAPGLFACGFHLWVLLERRKSPRFRSGILSISVATNLGLLGAFKYFDFFSISFQRCLVAMGVDVSLPVLDIVLPVGISFYTFQTLSYTIDVYRGKLRATDQLLEFMLFVSFFPQLVAGPIERASHLLPQILRRRKVTWQMVATGSQLALVGFFKKIVIADGLAGSVNFVYGSGQVSGLSVVLATYAFAFQIYCDFSGYTDIARGISRMMGFDICENFRLPYFATNPSEFWQRWHISLSTWLRDYLYIPLGGNRGGRFATPRNLALTMLIGGLWHGASIHFVAWGAYQGFLLMVFRMFSRDSSTIADRVPRRGPLFWVKVVAYFQLTCYGWLIFRAKGMTTVRDLTLSILDIGNYRWEAIGLANCYKLCILVVPLVVFQVYQYYKNEMEPWSRWPMLMQAIFYFVLFYLIVLFGAPQQSAFIYFQF